METDVRTVENSKKGVSVIGIIALVVLIVGEFIVITFNSFVYGRLIHQFGYSPLMPMLSTLLIVVFSAVAIVLAVIGIVGKKSNNALNIAALSIAIWNIATAIINMGFQFINMLRF